MIPPSGVILELELVSSFSGEMPERLEPPSRSPVAGKGELRWGGQGVAHSGIIPSMTQFLKWQIHPIVAG